MVERGESDFELAGMMAAENSTLRAANDAFHAGIGVLNQRIVEVEQRLAGVVAQTEGAAMRLRRTEEERGEVEQLVKRGLTPPERLVALRDEQARLSTQVQGLASDIADARAALEQAREAVPNFRHDRLSRISRDLTAVAAERAQVEPRIEDILARIARAELRAPAAGVVSGVAQFAAGTVLPGGGVPVLQIVSPQKKLVAEARMHPFARSVLEPGMEARVRLITSGLQESEPVAGRLTQISADAVTDRETNEAYYVAIVEIPSRRLPANQPAIRPGTHAEVIIPILDRTPLHYLFEPLVRKRELAMRQP
jgi:HlyD family type I secretion membrane fusion protein